METTIGMGLYWGYIGIMEKKMETTISLAQLSNVFLVVEGLGFRV